MKKINLFVALLFIIILFCGCGKFNVLCSIDQANFAKMVIEISIPTEGLSEEEIYSMDYIIYDLWEHWEDEDYEVSISHDDNNYDMYLFKKTRGKDLEDAVNKLLEMMGDDSSPFSFVEGGYSESQLNGTYNIKAKMDLANLLDYEHIKTLPQDQQDRITELMNSFSGIVSFEFDGTTKDYIGTLTNRTNTVELSFDEPAEIYSLVEVSNTQNQAEYDLLKSELADTEQARKLYLTLLLAAACAVILIAAAIVVISILRKKAKKKELEPEVVPIPEPEKPVES